MTRIPTIERKDQLAAEHRRRRSEPAAAGVRRLRQAAGLDEIVALHDRYRFDPAGISAREREAPRAKATAWLTAQAPDVSARESDGVPRR